MAYFSNGTEGEILDDQCMKCPFGNQACPVYEVQTFYNYKQMNSGNKDLKDAMEMLINEPGICRMRVLLESNLMKIAGNPTMEKPPGIPLHPHVKEPMEAMRKWAEERGVSP